MSFLVVDDPRDWPLETAGVIVVSARAYLTGAVYGDVRSAKVFNLCKSYRYQSLGYYVSLLAEARGQRPIPRIADIADKYSGRRCARRRGRVKASFGLAILHDPANPAPPSNAGAMRKFEKAAAAAGMQVEFITRADLSRLPAFDALFIRDTTFANHYTYRFSRRAAAEGLVTIDTAESILKCNNKVYLAELLDRHGIPTLKSLLVLRDNVREIVPTLGLPCVLKQPDSSFSVGVVKVETEQELLAKASELLAKSDLIIAQEYLPTAFDWRVGILGRRPLFVCKYFMAPGHWQIVKHGDNRHDYVEGPTLAVPLEDAPAKVVKTALKAANLIGDGFYGVDVKEVGKRCYVIEVNDNPTVDAGNEDGVLKDALYDQIIGEFARRIEARKRGAAR